MAQELLPKGNLVWYQGDDNDMQVVVTDPDTGLPVDLTGGKVWLVAKWHRGDPDSAAVILLDSDGPDVTLSDPLNGIALVTMQPNALDAIKPVAFLYWAVQARALIQSVPRTWEVATGIAVVRAGLIDALT